MERPSPKRKEFDYEKLVDLCESYLDEIETEDSEVGDTEHYIFEEALEMIYGKEIWKYINCEGKNI